MLQNPLSIEIILVVSSLALLILGLINSKLARSINGSAAVLVALALLVIAFGHRDFGLIMFDGAYITDGISWFFKLLFLVATILVLGGSERFADANFKERWQFAPLVLLAVLGMMVMASGLDLVVIYIGLEMMTVTFYILSAYMHADLRSYEAGLKYLILGAVSSAVLLLGLSYVYAMTGSTDLRVLGMYLHPMQSPAIVLTLVLIIAGLGFKISSVPFHMWAPDVYHGAPTPVTALLSVASKAAGFAVIVRILYYIFLLAAGFWVPCMAILAAITIIFGNLVAIPQTNMKRLLAYSSIAQAGYIMVGVVAINANGLKGIFFYSMVYVFANLGAFLILTRVEAESGSSEIQALSGLSKRSPFMAAMMTVCLLSLAGIPPLAGFIGKWYLFTGAVESGFLWLALIALVMSMVSVYYYLSVAKVMYIGEGDESRISLRWNESLVMWACFILTILAGVYPSPLVDIVKAVWLGLG